MTKYLISFQLWKKDNWEHYIDEVSITELIYFLEKVVNDSIDELFITFNPRRAATPIKKDTAKTLLTILSEEQNNACQKAFDEFYGEHEN